MSPPPILYVEDEENDVILLRRAFKKADVAAPLMTIGNGMEAMRYFAGEGAYADRTRYPLPGLLLLDLNLPGLSGFDLLRSLRRLPKFEKLLVIVFSSSSDRADIDQAQQLGAAEYLVKPVDMSAFVGIIQQLKKKWPKVFCDGRDTGRPTFSDRHERQRKNRTKEQEAGGA
jgi:CheY-like chemotaxis protein